LVSVGCVKSAFFLGLTPSHQDFGGAAGLLAARARLWVSIVNDRAESSRKTSLEESRITKKLYHICGW
jgi:hypothetical protein